MLWIDIYTILTNKKDSLKGQGSPIIHAQIWLLVTLQLHILEPPLTTMKRCAAWRAEKVKRGGPNYLTLISVTTSWIKYLPTVWVVQLLLIYFSTLLIICFVLYCKVLITIVMELVRKYLYCMIKFWDIHA